MPTPAEISEIMDFLAKVENADEVSLRALKRGAAVLRERGPCLQVVVDRLGPHVLCARASDESIQVLIRELDVENASCSDIRFTETGARYRFDEGSVVPAARTQVAFAAHEATAPLELLSRLSDGQEVFADEPFRFDAPHALSFQGVVDSIEDSIVSVRDGDDDIFDMEAHELSYSVFKPLLPDAAVYKP